ncbi:hypothetical protein [Williamsia phyllosphaerae]|uniref:Uncharacterized protein n=1 Tax=Williamsia phyllosphaerae TaxID=885042 RepID=A0ABQ1UTB6_9NOCA|nr:hypothetical protein [Williamsia phyllosphaerae]GGF26068.1 hypothetical protein GCM10007298_22450 [Williamsia phyllosphaerae]
MLDRRLAALDPAVHDVLRAAAVVDDVLDIRLLSRACGLDLDTVADLLDIAADRRIITTGSDSGGYVFAHGLLREEVVATMPAFARRRLHATVAENLGAISGGGDTLSRRAHHLMAAGPLVDPIEVVEACAAAADDAAARWSSETAAVWWRHALDSYDRLPVDEQDPSTRDRLTMALLQAEGRAGRGQTVLDTVRVQLLGAIDAGRVVTTGRLAGALLRSSGCWPWQAPSTDPGPLIEVLERAERFTTGDPEAHITVLAALAVGHCYNPDAAVPAGYLRRAADLAARTDDPDLTADALLAWLITYSGVATHSHETLVAVDRLLALDHAQSRVDTVIGHSVATMATMSLGDVAATENHLRRGIEGSEELRLPVLRAQLRWMESTLALWHGDLPEAHRQHAIARDVHEQTELYVAGSGMIAVMGLGWEQGTLSDLALTDDPMRWMQTVIEERGDNGMVGVVVAGTAAIAGARGDRSLAETMIDRWWEQRGVHVWTTLGNAVLLAHLVADLGLVDHVERFVADLAPFADRIAVIGQVGSAGPVSLALARLHRCVGRVDVACAYASGALALGERTGGIPTVLRARLLLADVADASPARTAEISDIAERAQRMGMRGVADAAAAVLAD